MSTHLQIPVDFPADQFWSRVTQRGDCWIWSGCRSKGYGVVGYRRKQYRCHRVAYELLLGPIPDGLVLDHLCRNRACVNPDHLEPVTHRVNIIRGEAPPALNVYKTHCSNGHPLEGDNLRLTAGGRRVCVTCSRDYHREYERARYQKDPERFAAEARERRARDRETYNRRARERRAAKREA